MSRWPLVEMATWRWSFHDESFGQISGDIKVCETCLPVLRCFLTCHLVVLATRELQQTVKIQLQKSYNYNPYHYNKYNHNEYNYNEYNHNEYDYIENNHNKYK